MAKANDESYIRSMIQKVQRSNLDAQTKQRYLHGWQMKLQQAIDARTQGGEAQTRAEAQQEQWAADEESRDEAAQKRIDERARDRANQPDRINRMIDQIWKALDN